MGQAISCALTLAGWREFRFLEDFSTRDLTWLLIGAGLAVLVFLVRSRMRRRWF